MNVEPPSRDQVLRYGALGFFLVIALGFLSFVLPSFIDGVGSYIVLSGSMAPVLHAGDAVFVVETPAEQIESGDVITYYSPGGQITTHQVVDITRENGELRFQTKGTANEEPDPYLVPPEAVIGKVVVSVPYLGAAVHYAGTSTGIILLLIIPAALLIASELHTIYSMITR